jgi:hypothetical protein
MSTVAALPAACANCGAPLGGPFCQACGQKAASPNTSLHEFFHEAFHEFAHVDGKIVQTLRRLLTRPGQLTRDFLDGRRQRYVSPIRLYLTCSLIFFALAAIAPRADRPFFTVSRAKGEAGRSPEQVRELRQEATEKANEAIVHNLPRVMFVLMPVFGMLTWLFYRRAQPFYAAHLYYSIHFHSYVFLLLTAAIGLRPLMGARFAATVAMSVIGYGHFASLKRVFGGSAWSMMWKGALIWLVYFAMVTGTVLTIGLWSAGFFGK